MTNAVHCLSAGAALTGLTVKHKSCIPLRRRRFDINKLNSSNENDAVKGAIITRLFWSLERHNSWNWKPIVVGGAFIERLLCSSCLGFTFPMTSPHHIVMR